MIREKKTYTVMMCIALLLAMEIYSQRVSFVTRKEFPTEGTNPSFVLAYDVDGDGNLDVLVGTTQGLMLMRGDGAGRLSAGENILPGPGIVNTVFAGDFNGDGSTDLAIGKTPIRGLSLVLLYGDGRGGFREPEFIQLPTDPPSIPIQSITGADFDGDKYIDLVITNSTNRRDLGAVTLFRGLASGGFDFNHPERFSVGDGQTLPRFVATADFNGDGYPDLVTANQIGNSVSVLLWNPKEDRFDLMGPYAMSGMRLPNFIATGDFNNDGFVDIAVANFQSPSGSISVLFGDGAGGFSAGPTIPTGMEPYLIAAHFNSTDSLDLAVSNRDATNAYVSIFQGNGRGGFSAPKNFAVSMIPKVLAAGDFNGDSILDLVVANSSSNVVTLLLGDGRGGFLTGEHGVGQGPSSVAVGDLNGDKRMDIAVTNRDSSTISILMANAGGGFDPPRTLDSKRVGNNPGTMIMKDMDGDNNLDLVVTFLNHVKIFFGDGTGNFPRIKPVFPGAGVVGITSMAIEDFDGDGNLDIALTSTAANIVTVMTGDGKGNFDHTNYMLQSPPQFIIAADFNSDGLPDLAVTNNTNPSSVSILLGKGKGSFAVRPPISLGAGATLPSSIAAGDFNGDRNLDLAITNAGLNVNSVSILFGNGQGGFDVGSPPRRIATPSPTFVTTGDFDGDGILDLALVNRTMNSASVFLGDGKGNFNLAGGFGLGTQGSQPNNPSFLVSVDINQDGKPDLVAVNYSGNSISILINDTAP